MIETRKSGNIVLATRNWYLKIPWLIRSLKENLEEKKNLKLAGKDSHFSKYLPVYRNFGVIIATEKLEKLTSHQATISDYFKEAFKDKDNWPVKKLKDLIHFEVLAKFLLKMEDENFYQKILKLCQEITLPNSSGHGDFHPENVMIDKNQKLKLIDWTRYNSKSSRYFDLIDYAVFLEKTEETWFDYWNNLYKKRPTKLFNIEIKREFLMAYAVWKISEELKTLYGRKMLNKYKIKKYKKFLNNISNLC